MKFLVVTFAPLLKNEGIYSSYGPYVREMEMWFEHCDDVGFCCPHQYSGKSLLLEPFKRNDFTLFPVPEISQKHILLKPWLVVLIVIKIYRAMSWTDHIHLRCPGNMGLLGAMVQILFPGKKKTAKYAGNWDWNSQQPWSYRMQQRILRNTFLTRNMKVLVYGDWPDKTRNILPFFTASYSDSDKTEVVKPDFSNEVNLAFIGTLSANKSPMTALNVLKLLIDHGIQARLTFCGDGPERVMIEKQIHDNNLQKYVDLLGNVSAEKVKMVLHNSHFLVFISRSEGWPKAVAEAMWWGCVPITSAVSCVPQMVGKGERGFLVENDPVKIAEIISEISKIPDVFRKISVSGMDWSREYTIERFKNEILKLV